MAKGAKMTRRKVTTTGDEDFWFTKEDLIKALKENPQGVVIVAPGNLRETMIYHNGTEEVVRVERKTAQRKRTGEISNRDLREEDIPPEGWRYGSELIDFALTFNGYEHWGSFDKCAEIANNALNAWKQKKVLPGSLTELRTCLFFEQRRWRHFGFDPDEVGDEDAITYLRAIIEAIRAKVRKGELD